MRPDWQLRAFNAEVTDSSIIVLPPCPHSCPPMLVLSFAMTGRAALDGVLLFPFHDTNLSRTGTALGDVSQQLWAFFSHPRTFSSSAWAFGPDIKMGRGIQIPWLHNSPSKSCCLDSRTGRRVLTSSGFLTGLSSLVICWHLRLFRLLTTHFWRFGILSMSPLNSGGSVLPTLDGVMAI